MATLDSGSVRLRLHGDRPFCSLGIVCDHGKQAYVAAVKLRLFQHTFCSPGKTDRGDQIPRDTLDSFPKEKNTRGDEIPRHTLDRF